MTAWTPVATSTETWTSLQDPAPAFSAGIFSHAFYSGKRVFALGRNVWDRPQGAIETWAIES